MIFPFKKTLIRPLNAEIGVHNLNSYMGESFGGRGISAHIQYSFHADNDSCTVENKCCIAEEVIEVPATSIPQQFTAVEKTLVIAKVNHCTVTFIDN